MKTINFRAKKFAVGCILKAVKAYKCGSIVIQVGEVGRVVKEKTSDYPDLGLFRIRVIDIQFSLHKVSMGESVADMYFEELK